MKLCGTERGREGERERSGGSARWIGWQYLVLSTKYLARVALLVLVLAGEVSAQTELRWKLKMGESLAVVIDQKTESLVTFGAKSATTKIDVKVSLGWTVTAADEKEFSIKQTIERIEMNLATPQGPAIGFDSAATARPTGQARELAMAMQPLVGAELEIKLSPRGEVLEVEPVNEAAKGLFAAEEKGGAAGDAPRAAVEKLLRQSLVVLPDKAVNTGESWKTTSELTTAAGPTMQETVYTLDIVDQVDGKERAEILMVSTLSPRDAGQSGKGEGARLKIISHEQRGKTLFSPDEGRVTSAAQTQTLVTEREYQNTKIVVKLNSTQRTTVEGK